MSLPRHPRGVPTGGRFAPRQHAEAPVSLAGDLMIDEEELSRHDWSLEEFDDPDSADEDTCSHCGASTDDGEGWDGMCGSCADRMLMHEGGEHDGNPRAGCPACPATH